MDKKNALEVEKLTKIYLKGSGGEIRALNNLDLKIKEGEIFGLLGPNGAGKTTFINILAGTVLKNSGKVNVWGFDLDKSSREVRASIGIVPQEINLDAFFSPRKLLELQAGLYGVTKKNQITDEILKMVSLYDKAESYSRSLSGGMKRRLLIAKAMVHQPPILILDEPTAGLDLAQLVQMRALIRKLSGERLILLSTHILQEVVQNCNRVVMLSHGVKKLDESLATLQQRHTDQSLETVVSQELALHMGT